MNLGTLADEEIIRGRDIQDVSFQILEKISKENPNINAFFYEFIAAVNYENHIGSINIPQKTKAGRKTFSQETLTNKIIDHATNGYKRHEVFVEDLFSPTRLTEVLNKPMLIVPLINGLVNSNSYLITPAIKDEEEINLLETKQDLYILGFSFLLSNIPIINNRIINRVDNIDKEINYIKQNPIYSEVKTYNTEDISLLKAHISRF